MVGTWKFLEKVVVMASRRMGRRLRLATAQSTVEKPWERGTTVSHRLSWRLTVEGIVGNNRGKEVRRRPQSLVAGYVGVYRSRGSWEKTVAVPRLLVAGYVGVYWLVG